MRSGDRRRRHVAVCIGTLVTLVGPTQVALADSPVSVTASGPERIVTSTDTSTGRILATFTIVDSSATATGAKICRSYADNGQQGCRYQRFDGQTLDDEYDDWYDDDEYTRWDIVGAPGSWTVSYPIGFDEISREECLAAAWQDAPFAAAIQVMNDAGVVLATSGWTYAVACTGIEGNSLGPARSRVYAGKSTRSKPFRFLALDTRRVLKSYRVCHYDSIAGRYRDCDRERLTAEDRTKDGNWFLSYNLTWRAMGSSLCNYIGRKWPQAGIRVQFYDGNLDKRLTLYRGTRLDC